MQKKLNPSCHACPSNLWLRFLITIIFLGQHILTHTKEKPFKCPFCTFKCARWDNLNKHSQNIHGMGLKMAEHLALETSKNGNIQASDNPENKVTAVTTTNNITNNTPNIMHTDQIMFQQINMKSTISPE